MIVAVASFSSSRLFCLWLKSDGMSCTCVVLWRVPVVDSKQHIDIILNHGKRMTPRMGLTSCDYPSSFAEHTKNGEI